ncbi:hypothetical protein F4815DRAFT_99889 [Daldinia loculata]|nr:hypothetical protein F4815DRAFT_99889 [Daldinia loculata]
MHISGSLLARDKISTLGGNYYYCFLPEVYILYYTILYYITLYPKDKARHGLESSTRYRQVAEQLAGQGRAWHGTCTLRIVRHAVHDTIHTYLHTSSSIASRPGSTVVWILGILGPFFFCCPPVGSAATWVSQPAAIPKFTYRGLFLGLGQQGITVHGSLSR